MSECRQLTEKQHYVPQVYLRGFMPGYLSASKTPSDTLNNSVYAHKLDDDGWKQRLVPIRSICYSKNIYEVRNEENEIILPNFLEKCFSVLEGMFADYRSRLESKAFIQENLKTKCFLTSEEKAFWKTFCILQVFRNPKVLDAAKGATKDFLGEELSEVQVSNLSKSLCLPLFKEVHPGDPEVALFERFYQPMEKMTFGVGVDTQRKIITSDNPVFIYAREYPCVEYDKIIMPITSSLCLFLYGGEEKKLYPKNSLFSIDEDDRQEIFKSITSAADIWIYSNYLFGKDEKQWIEYVLKERGEPDAVL